MNIFKYIISVLLVFVFFSCSSSKYNDKDLIGKWATFENGYTYVETWFDGENILYWNEEVNMYEFMHYHFDSANNIIHTFKNNSNDTSFTLTVESLSDNKLTVSNIYNTWCFQKINPINFQIDTSNSSIFAELRGRTYTEFRYQLNNNLEYE